MAQFVSISGLSTSRAPKESTLSASPTKVVFEAAKMGVGLFLLRNPNANYKIYSGCVFLMMCAVYFAFAKTFNDPNFEPDLRPITDSPVNAFLRMYLVSLMNFMASAIVAVIMIILNAADAVPVSIEAIITYSVCIVCIVIAAICQCVGVVSNYCNCCRSSASTVPTTGEETGRIDNEDGINEMTALLKDIELSVQLLQLKLCLKPRRWELVYFS